MGVVDVNIRDQVLWTLEHREQWHKSAGPRSERRDRQPSRYGFSCKGYTFEDV